MDFDLISLAALHEEQREWFSLCSRSGLGICKLADRYRKRDDCSIQSLHCGSFNFSIRLHWQDGKEDWLIRFPMPDKAMFLDEKVYREVVLMDYVARKTDIPVPKVICYSRAADNPTGLGPFIIMTWVEGRKLSDILREGKISDSRDDILNPRIDLNTLQRAYEQMAEIILSLWSLDFDKIGSLGVGRSTNGRPVVDGRPPTLEENELIRVGGMKDISEAVSPQKTYDSATDYIKHLLELQSAQLMHQRNSVYDSEDCRNKFVCRQLMKAIAPNFLPYHDEDKGDSATPFKLFWDDFCPRNILVNDSLEIVAVIDWGFCYAAPSQFAASIPWWLLLRRPEYLVNEIGPDSFFEAFLPKADLFLQALEQREQARGLVQQDGQLLLSARMRQSLEDRSAWFMLACRRVSSVDMIYWDMLDEYCWGPRSSMAERSHAFTGTGELHKWREGFVRLKMHQLREYYSELGEESEVIYVPPPPLTIAIAPQTPRSYNKQSNRSHVFLGGVVTGLAFGSSVALLIARYRR